jgi:hypothetical protein
VPRLRGNQTARLISQYRGCVLRCVHAILGSLEAHRKRPRECLRATWSESRFSAAQRDYLPHIFKIRGRRLLYSHGIYALVGFTAFLLIVFGALQSAHHRDQHPLLPVTQQLQ